MPSRPRGWAVEWTGWDASRRDRGATLLEQLPRDDQLLDLGGPLVDPERPDRAVEPIHRVIGQHALAADELNRIVHGALGHLGGERLRHGGLGGDPLLPLVLLERR